MMRLGPTLFAACWIGLPAPSQAGPVWDGPFDFCGMFAGFYGEDSLILKVPACVGGVLGAAGMAPVGVAAGSAVAAFAAPFGKAQEVYTSALGATVYGGFATGSLVASAPVWLIAFAPQRTYGWATADRPDSEAAAGELGEDAPDSGRVEQLDARIEVDRPEPPQSQEPGYRLEVKQPSGY